MDAKIGIIKINTNDDNEIQISNIQSSILLNGNLNLGLSRNQKKSTSIVQLYITKCT